MNKNWIIAILVMVGYLAAAAGTTYYYTVPSQSEKQAQHVVPNLINASPVSDEIAQKLGEREKFGEWPIVISDDRTGKFNPFRF